MFEIYVDVLFKKAYWDKTVDGSQCCVIVIKRTKGVHLGSILAEALSLCDVLTIMLKSWCASKAPGHVQVFMHLYNCAYWHWIPSVLDYNQS